MVKKPKLDQHRGRCGSSFPLYLKRVTKHKTSFTGSSFTCIDCSKTFPTPADYKSHTSCVSEAEKYEKSVYRGPKHDQVCVVLA